MKIKKSEAGIILTIILITSFLLRLPGFFKAHLENDEVIYRTLVEKNSFKLRDYTLQGTGILQELSKKNYDFACFPHPPVFVYLETVFFRVFGKFGLMIVPVLSMLGVIWLVYKMGEQLYGKEKGLLASAIMAVCPVLFFISTKIWIDSLLVFLVSLCSYLILQIKKPWQAVLPGFVFSLAMLTKYPAVFVLPAILLLIISKFKKWEEIFLALVSFFAPLLIMIPWFLYNLMVTGKIYKDYSTPSKELIEKFPFVKMMVNRPVWFYAVQLVLVFPAYVLGYLGVLGSLRKKNLGKNMSLAVWFLGFLGGLTLFGLRGGGYQTRYIAPGLPALALLSVGVLPEKLEKWQVVLLFGVMIYGLVLGILNSYVYGVADLVVWRG